MDSITHIVLGGILGEAYAGKELGKRAMVIGALAQSLPDIDFIASLWLDEADNLLAHRGFTHSFLFAALVTPLLVWWAARSHINTLSYKRWAFFLGGQIFIHLFLDGFNAYGTGWLEPFSHQRFSFNTLFVVDPLYTLWLVVAFVALAFFAKQNPSRGGWIKFSLSISSLYLVLAITSKILVYRDVRNILENQNTAYVRYFTTPTPLNSLLWFVVVEDATGYHVGYRSVLDKSPVMDLQHFDRQDSLLKPFLGQNDTQKLIRFSEGYYTIEHWGDTLVFNDLRFGQMAGWLDPNANFVFHYYIQYPEQNTMVMQRGRFERWNRATVESLLEKIKGI